ncbi:MAG TPA: hypothetical protein VJB57_13425 [Dehalococcoidia bacterium]|nr:hypothetical protein [Dehalococcoidia bacterium]
MKYTLLAVLTAVMTLAFAASAPSLFADDVVPGLQPPPAGWPSTLELGMSSPPDQAASMRETAPFGFRYQYLAGGANTGTGWSTWNPSGTFVTNYIDDSVSNGIVPVFTYYVLRQSQPGREDGDDIDANMKNLQDAATMKAYWEDVKLFFLRAAGEKLVVLQVEPDLWGFMQTKSTRDNAATVPAKVGSTGVPELNGLPDDMAGFAQAFVRLRDRYASNVSLGYHLSIFGTGVDPVYNNPSFNEIDRLAARSSAFYKSLNADFDVVFMDASDRDAGFNEVVNNNRFSWWDEDDYSRSIRYVATFGSLVQKRVVLWQIPLGNTRMRAVNNTRYHYQDNHVEWLLEDTTKANLRRYGAAGVIALLFGGGAEGQTCACDAAKDGVTNPNPIGNNQGTSNSADDDGGFFRHMAAEYYKAGRLLIGQPSAPVQVALRQPIPTATPTPTPVATCIPARSPAVYGQPGQNMPQGQIGPQGQYLPPNPYSLPGQVIPPGQYGPAGQYPYGTINPYVQPGQAASSAAYCDTRAPTPTSTPDPTCYAGSSRTVVETGPDGRLRAYLQPC